MAAFVGKWRQDEFDSNNFKEFIKVAGVSEDLAEESFKVRIIWEIQQDGKKWMMNVKTTTEPILTKNYEFTIGEPYESTDLFGRKFKMVTEVESDTKIRETCSEWSETTIEIVREVKGDKMVNTATCKEAEMYMTFTRM